MGIPSPNGGARQQPGRRQGRVIPFGKYLLLERIAVGGMAEVYMAKSFGIEGFEKILAIKRILPTMAEDEDFIEMFIDEAKIAGQLNHANIAPIFELGKIGDSHYIAMEYVWGKDLLQIMNRFRRLRKKMPGPMVAWVASKMCEALDYAHQKRDRRGQTLNIIHRDISPQNVLVSYEGEVKLIDFGIAKAASRTTKTQAGVLKGKFGYMSPEQVRGLPIDLRSDIFAVGTCMYEMLTSERLFMGESDFSTLEKVRNATVSPVSQVVRDIPPPLEQVVMKALSREPADRFQTAGELQESLQRFLAGQRPPFGTSKLAAWLKTAFATEMAKEKQRLDSFAHVGRPSVLAGPRKRTLLGGPAIPPGGPDPAARRPPPRPPMSPAAMPPAGPPGPDTNEISASDIDVLDDLEAESTMISASPFEEEWAGVNDEELAEEATQIFFSSEETQEAPEQRGAPLQDPRPLSQGVMQGTFRPGHSNAASTSRPPSAPPLGAPPPTMPRPAAPLGGIPPQVAGPLPAAADRVDSSAFRPPPARPAPIKAEPTPVVEAGQRRVATMEMAGGGTSAMPAQVVAPVRDQSSGKMVALFALAAVVMLGVGVGSAWLVFGGDEYGTIEVHTTPSEGAIVHIDGVPRGRVPVRVDRIPTGERTIMIEGDGFQPATRRVNVQSGSVSLLEIALERVDVLAQAGTPSPPDVAPAPTAVEGEDTEPSEVAGAAAPEPAPEPAPAAAPEPAPEPRTERPRAPVTEPRAPSDTRMTVTAPREPETTARPIRREPQTAMQQPRQPTTTMETTVTPQPAAAGFGTLVINTIPWAHVFIDGRDTSQNTPVRNLRVRAGTHRLGLRTPDDQMHDFTVEVPAGETVRFSRRLGP